MALHSPCATHDDCLGDAVLCQGYFLLNKTCGCSALKGMTGPQWSLQESQRRGAYRRLTVHRTKSEQQRRRWQRRCRRHRRQQHGRRRDTGAGKVGRRSGERRVGVRRGRRGGGAWAGWELVGSKGWGGCGVGVGVGGVHGGEGKLGSDERRVCAREARRWRGGSEGGAGVGRYSPLRVD